MDTLLAGFVKEFFFEVGDLALKIVAGADNRFFNVVGAHAGAQFVPVKSYQNLGAENIALALAGSGFSQLNGRVDF